MKKYNNDKISTVGQPVDLSYFEPIQVKVRNGRFEEACKIFKSIVQKEQVLNLFNEKSRYEKPSVKKRRKSAEATQRKLAAEAKQKLLDSGEWEKRKLKKEQKRSGSKVEKKTNEGI